MHGDFLNGQGSDFDHKTTGRWSREEHEKFIEGINSKDIISKIIYIHINILVLKFTLIFIYSYESVWAGLEEGRTAHWYSFRCTDQKSCVEIL